MDIMYCDNCGFQIAADAFTSEKTVHADDGKVYCAKCSPLFEHTISALIRVSAIQAAIISPTAVEKPPAVTKFYFCETCGKRITDRQIDEGLGRDKKLKGVYCKDCAVGVMTMEMDAINIDQLAKAKGKPPSLPLSGQDQSRRPLRKASGIISVHEVPLRHTPSKTPLSASQSRFPLLLGIGSVFVITIVVAIVLRHHAEPVSNMSEADPDVQKKNSGPAEKTPPSLPIALAQQTEPAVVPHVPMAKSLEPAVQTAAISVNEQIEHVREELKKLNPGFNGSIYTQIKDGQLTLLMCASEALVDLAPLKELASLQSLRITPSRQSKLSDLSPLRNLKKLSCLELDCNCVNDLSPLQDLPNLRYLSMQSLPITRLDSLKGIGLYTLQISDVPIVSIEPLRRMPLIDLMLAKTPISDISVLQGMRLIRLNISDSKIQDISVLKGMRLNALNIAHTNVSDLTPIRGMPLTECLNIEGAPVKDLEPILGITTLTHLSFGDNAISDYSPLKSLPLVSVEVIVKPGMDLEFLRNMPTLKTINKISKDQFLEKLPLPVKK